MARSTVRRRRLTLPLLASLFLLAGLTLSAGPALAHHADWHEKGGGNGPAGSSGNQATVTEDDDGDGVPNTPDPVGDADNKHPSGKDKHAESGGSGNQGKSASDPDANGKGPERGDGLDKPDGDGGADILDQDGNNGCGNDDDFDDDNEGRCLGPKKAEQGPGGDAPGQDEGPGEEEPGDEGGTGGEQPEETGEQAEVSGEVVGQDESGEVESGEEVLGELVASVSSTGAEMLGISSTRSGELAFTGYGTIPTVAGGLALLGAGAGLLAATRSRRP